MKKNRFPWLLVLFIPFIVHCSYINDLASEHGGIDIQFGDYVLWKSEKGEVNKKPSVHSSMAAIPKKIIVKSPARKKELPKTFGSCHPLKDPGLLERFKTAKVIIEKIRLGRADSQSWKEIPVNPYPADLLRLSRSLSTLLSSQNLPAGDFNEIRIIVSRAFISDEQGNKHPLPIPGGQASGIQIKLNRDITVIPGKKQPAISLNFCTESNFLVEENSSPVPSYTFHPVINKVINISI